jgi:hypothetical protein
MRSSQLSQKQIGLQMCSTEKDVISAANFNKHGNIDNCELQNKKMKSRDLPSSPRIEMPGYGDCGMGYDKCSVG